MANPPNHPNQPQQQSKPAPVPIAALTSQRRTYLAKQYGLTESQIDVVRSQVCATATDEELEFFLATAKRLQLEPLARQIWFVKRRQSAEDSFGNRISIEVGKPETGIDGFRTIAERSGEYDGQDPIEWCGTDGVWSGIWIPRRDPDSGKVTEEFPYAARATIYRKGIARPFVAVALFEEYAPRFGKDQRLSPMWFRMGTNQIAKCAEALALRKGFPRDLSGIHTDDEMAQAVAADAVSTGFAAPAAASTPAQPQLEAKRETFADVVEPATVKQAAPVEVVSKPPANAKPAAARAEPPSTTSAKPAATPAAAPGSRPNFSALGDPPNDLAVRIMAATSLDEVRACMVGVDLAGAEPAKRWFDEAYNFFAEQQRKTRRGR